MKKIISIIICVFTVFSLYAADEKKLLGGTIGQGQYFLISSGTTITCTNLREAEGGVKDSNGEYKDHKYSWEEQQSGNQWINLTGATGSSVNITVTFLNSATSKTYRRKVVSGTQVAYSNTITVSQIPTTVSMPGETYLHITANYESTVNASLSLQHLFEPYVNYPYGSLISTDNVRVEASQSSFFSTYLSGSTGLLLSWTQNGGATRSGTINMYVKTMPGMSDSEYKVFMITISQSGLSPVNAGQIVYDYSPIEAGERPKAIVDFGNTASRASYIWWQYSEDGNEWHDIIEANELSYTPEHLYVTTHFRRALSNGVTTVFSEPVTVSVSTPLHTYEPGNLLLDKSKNYISKTIFLDGLGKTANIDVMYYDGLGRQDQTISVNGGGDGQDIITPIAYDAMGRQSKEYLPYAVSRSSRLGEYRTGAISEQISFCNSTYGSASGIYSFAESIYEASPLNRIAKSYKVGSAFRSGDGISSTFAYETNTASDILYFKVNVNTKQLECSSRYDAGVLFKNRSTNEDGAVTVTYTDLLGRVVLEQVVDASNNNETFDTYHVYDDFGNLCYVLPPKLSEAITSGTLTDLTDNNTSMKELAYVYKYDGRNRCIEKRLPGAASVYMVYDKADRLVMSQDGNMRGSKLWTYTVYDNFGRPVRQNLVQRHSSNLLPDPLRNSFNADAYPITYPTEADSWRMNIPFDGSFTHMATLSESRYGGSQYLPDDDGIPNYLEFGRTAECVIISEIMYDSPLNERIGLTNTAYSDGEYIELFNPTTYAIDLTGWKLTGGGSTETFNFPSGTIIPAKGYYIIAYRHSLNNFEMKVLYTVPPSTPYIIYQRKIILSNGGETLSVIDKNGNVVDAIFYDGTSNKTKPDRLNATNADGTPGMQCVSLHRMSTSYDSDGFAIASNSDWVTAPVSPLSVPNMATLSTSKSAPDSRMTGLLAYEKIAILDGQNVSEDFVERAYYYDYMGRAIRTVEKNHLGGISRTSNRYDFTGNVIVSLEQHGDVTEDPRTEMLLSDRQEMVETTIYPANYVALVPGRSLRVQTAYAKNGQIYDPEGRYFNLQTHLPHEKYFIVSERDNMFRYYYVPENCIDIVTRTSQSQTVIFLYTSYPSYVSGAPYPACTYLGDAPRTEYTMETLYDTTYVHTHYAFVERDRKLNEFIYDHRGRLKKETTTLNGGEAAVVSYGYDELGRLVCKTYGEGANAVTETHSYNIQGWLTQKSSSVFDMKLSYFNTSQDPLKSANSSYTGNIAEWEWQHKGLGVDNTLTTYAFTYDKLARLKETALYRGTSANSVNSFTEQGITYDKNGNMLTLKRYQSNANTPAENLTFPVYNGNQLKTITSNGTSSNFSYDSNGNLAIDKYRSLIFKHNLLNLTATVSNLSNVVHTTYRWLANGTKIGVKDSVGTAGYEYLGSLVYKYINGELQLESTGFSSGRIMVSEGGNGNVYTPNYFFTDHLSSTRVIYDGSPNAVHLDYLPFGTKWTGGQASTSRYNFTGYEDQDIFDARFMDAGARFFDGLRFTNIDPLAEKRPWESPYVFCGNNPVNRIDPNGMIWDDVKAAEMLKKNIDGQIASLNNNTAKKQAELDGGGLSEKKITNLENTILENKERVSNLMQSIADIDKLGADQENTYAFSPISGGKHQVRKGDDGKIYIETSSNALSVHEITHVRQSLDAGGLKFSPNGALLNSGANVKSHSYMEVEAYRMQYSHDKSFPGRTNSLQGIDVHSVGYIWNPIRQQYAYPIIKAYSDSLK